MKAILTRENLVDPESTTPVLPADCYIYVHNPLSNDPWSATVCAAALPI